VAYDVLINPESRDDLSRAIAQAQTAGRLAVAEMMDDFGGAPLPSIGREWRACSLESSSPELRLQPSWPYIDLLVVGFFGGHYVSLKVMPVDGSGHGR
jgi:hypothetical protein